MIPARREVLLKILICLLCACCACGAVPRSKVQLPDGGARGTQDGEVGLAGPASAVLDQPAGLPLKQAVQVPRLVISELLVDPLLRDEGAGDYLEVVNLSQQAVRLADVSVALPNGKLASPLRPDRPFLLAGEVAVLQAQGGEGRLLTRGLRLPNAAGRVELRWRSRVVDAAIWLRKRPWPKARPGVALERVAPDRDGQLPGAWRAARQVVDRLERGSPGTVAWPCSSVVGTALEGHCVVRTQGARAACGSRGQADPVRTSAP